MAKQGRRLQSRQEKKEVGLFVREVWRGVGGWRFGEARRASARRTAKGRVAIKVVEGSGVETG